jgi:hypothetical protein
MIQPESLPVRDALAHAARLRALADHLDPEVETRTSGGHASPDDLREVADLLGRIYAGGDPDAAGQQP